MAEPGPQPLITGRSRLYAIIGDPIEQVKSPEILNPIMSRAGTAAILVPMQIAPTNLETAIRGIKAIGNFDGIVITVPHKMRMLALVDEVLPTGMRVGAINAVRRQPDGRWVGDMFDGKGFVAGLRKHGHEPKGKRALLVGAGGAGSAVGYALAEAGVTRLTVRDADHAKAERLARGIAQAFPAAGADVGLGAAAGYELVVNATPIGMAPGDPSPIDPTGFKPGMVVADVIILAHDTPLLAAARASGCAVLGGRPMTEGQAEEMARFLGMTAGESLGV
jgi:shikimate dehydrogenase